ncbi:MAG: hypothetical protein ACRBBN_14790 [Methyloligellaceae bacterium]
MVDYSYLSASNRQQPAQRHKIEGQVLLSGKYEVPLYWYALFSPHDIKYPKFNDEKEDGFWYREQPPYLITSKEKAISRLAFRQKYLFKLLNKDQIVLYDQFSEIIKSADYSYFHLYADPIVRSFEFGILRKKMLDTLHSFERLENPISDVDLLFSPISHELGVDPKSFPLAWIMPTFIIRKIQHKIWEWKGISIYERDTIPLRSERSFVPPSQFNLVGSGESIDAPWQ